MKGNENPLLFMDVQHCNCTCFLRLDRKTQAELLTGMNTDIAGGASQESTESILIKYVVVTKGSGVALADGKGHLSNHGE